MIPKGRVGDEHGSAPFAALRCVYAFAYPVPELAGGLFVVVGQRIVGIRCGDLRRRRDGRLGQLQRTKLIIRELLSSPGVLGCPHEECRSGDEPPPFDVFEIDLREVARGGRPQADRFLDLVESTEGLRVGSPLAQMDESRLESVIPELEVHRFDDVEHGVDELVEFLVGQGTDGALPLHVLLPEASIDFARLQEEEYRDCGESFHCQGLLGGMLPV